VASEETLAKISRHLRSAEERLVAEAARTKVSITRAQVRIEGLLGRLPLGGSAPGGRPLSTSKRPRPSRRNTSWRPGSRGRSVGR
jgi:hypothetical protein